MKVNSSNCIDIESVERDVLGSDEILWTSSSPRTPFYKRTAFIYLAVLNCYTFLAMFLKLTVTQTNPAWTNQELPLVASALLAIALIIYVAKNSIQSIFAKDNVKIVLRPGMKDQRVMSISLK